MRILTGVIAIALACVLARPSFAGDKKKGEAKTETRNQARYDRLKEYSTSKYENDLDFRDEVDEAYDNLMRDHSRRAYERNTRTSSRIVTVREDRWRVHENLYDNLLVQDQINRIGQRLMPPESERAFAFKVIPEPTPLAETLATGTIYVSTGLISLLDSEAQLAYVLAHEAAHVQLDHWRERVKLECGQKAYNDEQAAKLKKLALFGGLLGGALGAGLGGSGPAAFGGVALGAAAGAVAGLLFERPLIVNWDKVEEDAADEYALKRVLEAAYDVREVPNLYIAMQKVAVRDTRVGLGFLGNRRRIEQRLEKARTLLDGAYKADIEARLKTGFLSSSAEHRNLMAELKRDNGIMAYYHDMFELARVNLSEATAIRENDPAAHYYYGKVMKLIGRTEEDLKLARDEFNKTAKYDRHDENFGSHLHLAMMSSREKDPDKKQIVQQLDEYVTNYAQWNVTDRALRAFPPNLETIYEFMTLYGDPGWAPKPPDLRNLPAYQAVNAYYSYGAAELPPASPVAPSSNPTPGQPAGGPASPIQGIGVQMPGTRVTVPVPLPPVKKH